MQTKKRRHTPVDIKQKMKDLSNGILWMLKEQWYYGSSIMSRYHIISRNNTGHHPAGYLQTKSNLEKYKSKKAPINPVISLDQMQLKNQCLHIARLNSMKG